MEEEVEERKVREPKRAEYPRGGERGQRCKSGKEIEGYEDKKGPSQISVRKVKNKNKKTEHHSPCPQGTYILMGDQNLYKKVNTRSSVEEESITN